MTLGGVTGGDTLGGALSGSGTLGGGALGGGTAGTMGVPNSILGCRAGRVFPGCVDNRKCLRLRRYFL